MLHWRKIIYLNRNSLQQCLSLGRRGSWQLTSCWQTLSMSASAFWGAGLMCWFVRGLFLLLLVGSISSDCERSKIFTVLQFWFLSSLLHLEWKLSASVSYIVVINMAVLYYDSSRWQETKFFGEVFSLDMVHARVSYDLPPDFQF